MVTPATLAQSRSTLSELSTGVYDQVLQQRMADPRVPCPGPFPKEPKTSDGEIW